MKVNILNNLHANNGHGDFVAVAVLAIMSDKLKNAGPLNNSILPDEEGNIDIQFIINGHELSFVPFIEKLEKEYNAQVRTTALSIIKERMQAIDNAFFKLEKEILATAETIFPDVDNWKE